MQKHRMEKTSPIKSTFSLIFPDIRKVPLCSEQKQETNQNLNLQLVGERAGFISKWEWSFKVPLREFVTKLDQLLAFED